MLKKLYRNKKGQSLVEYALLIAGVALISAAAVSVFGHKTSDLIAAVASILPGAHAGDNGPIVSGELIETAPNGTNGAIELNVSAMQTGTPRLGTNVLGATTGTEGFGGLVVESNP